MRLPTLLQRPGALLSLLLLPQGVLAGAQEPWYRVELLVFSNEATRSNELFEPTPTLQYPNAARFLVEPERVRANAQAHPDSHSAIDEFGRQILTPVPAPMPLGGGAGRAAGAPLPDTAAERAPGPSTGAAPQHLAAHTQPPDPNAPLDPNEPVATAKAALPTPFVVLPEEQLEFRDKAASMQRSGRYHTLFHAAWLQPVPDESAALPIILDHSGDSGSWPRLQGSITLFLSRYLHVSTNLWLNTSGDYLGGSDWRMPAAPLGPPAVIIEAPPTMSGDAPLDPVATPAGPQRAAPFDPDQPAPPGSSHAPAAVGPAPSGSGEGWASDPNEPHPEAIAGPQYPFRHAVLLQQGRRMRSAEVYYIDHPLFGVVLKLTALSAQELAAAARAEALRRAQAQAMTGPADQAP
ncbi:MAG: hypothetical protein KDI16_07375 [Halioglobus sp.]|nr:hypothetical protein [Halioglobus sp.]